MAAFEDQCLTDDDLKVLPEDPFAGTDAKRRFEREIALVGSLRHPNIVPLFDSGALQGRYHYAHRNHPNIARVFEASNTEMGRPLQIKGSPGGRALPSDPGRRGA
ncbi:MAG: hypothetical protein HY717_01440 [Planctomycetes bacterium]|nr:hypothetical protein [Planctomycetota bacterium]